MFPVRDILMDTFFSWGGFSVVLVAVVYLALKRFLPRIGFMGQDSRGDESAYYSKPAMTWMEQGFYYRLLKALPDHMVLAQVQLARILGVKEGYPYRTYHNRINQMSVDFVVCRKDGSVLAVIELDDSTHERADRKIADAKKDKALTSAGIRVVRWQAKSLPSVEMIGFYFSSDKAGPALQVLPRSLD